MPDHDVAFELVTSTDRLQTLVTAHLDEPRYAIDTEFLQQRTFIARLALVQIAWPDFIILVDPFTVDLRVLAPLFESESVALAHAASNDLPLLREAVGTLPRRTFDTEVAAQLLGLPSTSLQGLVSRYLDLELDKAEQVRDWTTRPLPDAALAYAANDVIHLFDLVDELTADLVFCDRLDAHDQECAFQLGAVGQSDPEMVWWRVKDLQRGSLEEKLRGQYLFAARDEIAYEVNLPRNYVISEEDMVALCRRVPTSPEDLQRRLSRYTLATEDVTLLWGALTAAASATLSDLRVADADVGDGEPGLQLTVAKLYVRYVAHQWRVSPAFIASHRDLVKFFRSEPSRLDLPWRVEALSGALALVRVGEASLRIVGPELLIERVARD